MCVHTCMCACVHSCACVCAYMHVCVCMIGELVVVVLYCDVMKCVEIVWRVVDHLLLMAV